MRFLFVCGVLVLASACGSSEEGGKVDTGKVVPTAASATIAPTAIPTSSAAIGDIVQTKAGNTVRIYSYEAPATGGSSFETAKDGKMFAAIDVEACAGATPDSGSLAMNPFNFEMQMPDNTRLQQFGGWKEPALHSTKLAPTDCVRGWVTFEVPLNTKPAFVIFEGSSQIKWRVP